MSSTSFVPQNKNENEVQMAMDVERPGPKPDEHGAMSWRAYLMENVDPKRSMSPLASYCFMTGFMCVVSLLWSCSIT